MFVLSTWSLSHMFVWRANVLISFISFPCKIFSCAQSVPFTHTTWTPLLRRSKKSERERKKKMTSRFVIPTLSPVQFGAPPLSSCTPGETISNFLSDKNVCLIFLTMTEQPLKLPCLTLWTELFTTVNVIFFFTSLDNWSNHLGTMRKTCWIYPFWGN